MAFRSPSIAMQAPAAPLWCDTPRQRFLDALPIISSVIRDLGRRYHLSRDERDEFAGNVTVRLMDGDYAVLRRFQGRSSLSTFLRTVITRQFLDARTKAWGRWRPSADAVRLGPTAVALERLLERQRIPLDQAIETLRARDETLDEGRLHDLAAQLPRRVPRLRIVDPTALDHVAATDPSPEQVLADERAAEARVATTVALRQATETLTTREQLLLRLRYEQGAHGGRDRADAGRGPEAAVSASRSRAGEASLHPRVARRLSRPGSSADRSAVGRMARRRAHRVINA